MGNRKLPFGYEMRRGIICVNAAEAAIVKEIYAAYTSGMSYRLITDSLNAQPVTYNGPDKLWNKNMVARILSNDLYTGRKPYPAIISVEEYGHAACAKPAVRIQVDKGTAKVVRQLSRCAACGSTLALSANSHGWERWNCPSCNAISADAVMPDTIDALSHIVTMLKAVPALIQVPPQTDQAAQSIPAQMEGEFNSFIHAERFDESAAKAAVIALAATRFDVLGSEDYEAMRIQYLLSRAEPKDELDTTLLRQITSAILIHPSGAVSLKLKNGQIIEAEHTPLVRMSEKTINPRLE